jgi:hypothetical protein
MNILLSIDEAQLLCLPNGHQALERNLPSFSVRSDVIFSPTLPASVAGADSLSAPSLPLIGTSIMLGPRLAASRALNVTSLAPLPERDIEDLLLLSELLYL